MESANKTWQSYKVSPWASNEDAAMKVAVMETNICKEMNSLPIRIEIHYQDFGLIE